MGHYVKCPIDSTRSLAALLARAHSVNANSKYSLSVARELFPHQTAKAKVIYYGTALGKLERAPHVPRPYALCAARLAERKGLDILALAFAEAVERLPSLHLVLCGEDHSGGALQSLLRKLRLSDRVTWLGQLPHGQVLSLMKGCRFFVLPSRRESLGGAIIEAMQAGKAVVATRVGGVPELVKHGREGLLVPPKDARSLSDALVTLGSDHSKRRRMERAARLSAKRFDWARALKEYSRIHAGHPDAGKGRSAFVVWEKRSDQTAQALARNIETGFPGKKPRIFFLDDALEPRGIGVWHFFSIRDIPVTPFLRFCERNEVWPVVTLA